MPRRVHVFGPAYLDRVLVVDRPLVDPTDGPPLDRSVEGTLISTGPGLLLTDANGHRIRVEPPAGWPGPTGAVRLRAAVCEGPSREERTVRGLSWHDDLGGMGSGFASALGGRLVSALGPEADPISQNIAALLARQGIEHRPIRVAGPEADWTLLLTSGPFGDKLPIGFRGCHAALRVGELVPQRDDPCDLRVVAGLPNPLAEAALSAPGAAVRFFAPARRNMDDRSATLARFAGAIDILSCNLGEWEALPGAEREAVAVRVPIVVVTEGARGGTVRYRSESADRRPSHRFAAFPREHPPRDTNRAGEAFAATFVATLLDAGWSPGTTDRGLIEQAALRGSAASALVLDRAEFGFPGPPEIDDALRKGRVGDPADAGRGGPG